MSEQGTVTYSIAEVLTRIESKIDKMDEKVNTIEVKLATIETEARNLKEDVRDIKTVQNTLVTEVSDLKGVKSLVIPIVVAIATALLTLLFRVFPTINP